MLTQATQDYLNSKQNIYRNNFQANVASNSSDQDTIARSRSHSMLGRKMNGSVSNRQQRQVLSRGKELGKDAKRGASNEASASRQLIGKTTVLHYNRQRDPRLKNKKYNKIAVGLLNKEIKQESNKTKATMKENQSVHIRKGIVDDFGEIHFGNEEVVPPQRQHQEAEMMEKQRVEAMLNEQRRQQELRRQQEAAMLNEQRRQEELRRQQEAAIIEEQKVEAMLNEQRRQQKLRRQQEAAMMEKQRMEAVMNEQRRQQELRRQQEAAMMNEQKRQQELRMQANIEAEYAAAAQREWQRVEELLKQDEERLERLSLEDEYEVMMRQIKLDELKRQQEWYEMMVRQRQLDEMKRQHEEEVARQTVLEELKRQHEEEMARQRALEELKRQEQEEKRMMLARQKEQEALKIQQEEERKRRKYAELTSKFVENAPKEKALAHMKKQQKMVNLFQQKTKPWLFRARHNIEKRNAGIAKRAEALRFSKGWPNPYTGRLIDNLYKKDKSRTPEMIKERVKVSIRSEEFAKEFNDYKDEDELMANIWKKEDVNGFAYREVRKKLYQPQVEGKHAWTYLISCDPTAKDSFKWFSHKFGLDDEFHKKTSRYDEVDITTKLIDQVDQLYPKLNNEVEALTFVLPERTAKYELQDSSYWQAQRERFAELTKTLSRDRPDFQCPLLITKYIDNASDEYDTLYNLPQLLDFKENKAIIDYHVLLMHKESIPTRIVDEMFWLFEASVSKS